MNRLRLFAATLLLAGSAAFSTSPVRAESADATGTPGVYASHIVIGQTLGLTGAVSVRAKEYMRGARLYFDWRNIHGGIQGRSIFLKSLDDGYDPERAVENVRQLVERDKVFALFANIGTAPTLAIMPLLAQYHVPLIAPMSGAEQLRTPTNPYVFNVRASYYDEAEGLVDYAVKQGKKSIAVLYQDDGFGKSGLDGTVSALKRRNLSLVAAASYPRDTAEVAAALNTIKAAKPDAVIMVSVAEPAAAFLQQARQTGLKALFLTFSPTTPKELAEKAWADAEGTVVSMTVPFPDDKRFGITEEFEDAQTEMLGTALAPTYNALEGFYAAKVLAQGVEDAGTDLTRERFIAALESFDQRDFGGIKLTWNKTSHEGSPFLDLFIVGRHTGDEGNLWFY